MNGIDINPVDMGFKIIGIVVLVIVLLFFLTWSGLIRCGEIPYWCEVYETVMGSPRVLIVYGDEGLGNPEELRLLLMDPRGVAVNAVDIAHLDTVSMGNLSNYQLVIVQKAKRMSIDQLSMFIEYVNIGGGRLVWVGDAGTERPADELDDSIELPDRKFMLDNPWMRAKETDTEYKLLPFDEFLGIRYIGNYCDEFNCVGESFSVGLLKPELTGNHHLIYGISPVMELIISPERDFAIVEQFPRITNSKIVLNLDQGSVKQGANREIKRFLPIITTSAIGERVAYYAYPLEYFCEDNDAPNACILLLKRMFDGMLGR